MPVQAEMGQLTILHPGTRATSQRFRPLISHRRLANRSPARSPRHRRRQARVPATAAGAALAVEGVVVEVVAGECQRLALANSVYHTARHSFSQSGDVKHPIKKTSIDHLKRQTDQLAKQSSKTKDQIDKVQETADALVEKAEEMQEKMSQKSKRTRQSS